MEPVAERILQSAVQLFARKGFAATTTREIIEAAGVTKPMLYYYFESKEGVCRAALTRHMDQFRDQIAVVMARDLPPREHLVDVVWEHMDFYRRNQDYARLIHALYFGGDDANINFDFDARFEEGVALMQQVIERVAAAGLVRAGRERDLTLAIKGMMFVFGVVNFKRGVEPTREDAERLVTDLLEGFGPSRSAGSA